jgi:hypothetical protein
VVLNTSDSLANIIFGLPWLKDDNFDINWTTGTALNRQTNSIIFFFCCYNASSCFSWDYLNK